MLDVQYTADQLESQRADRQIPGRPRRGVIGDSTGMITMKYVLAVMCLVVLAGPTGAIPTALAKPTLGTKMGQMYPDFLLPNVDGGLGRLSDYRGRKVLLIHFASS